MGRVGRPGLLGDMQVVLRMAPLVAAVYALAPSPLWGQFPPNNRFELSDTVYVDEPESAARAHLEQVKAYVASAQWDEAIDVLRTVAERYGDKLVKRPPPAANASPPPPIIAYSNLRDYCQWQIAALPAAALTSYRARVDDQAEQAFHDAVAARDRVVLEGLVEQFFCSSWGDDALLAWGDLALEAGDIAAARAAWERIFPDALGTAGAAASIQRLTFPDSSLSRADVAARLILASLLEQDVERAQGELSEFARLYPHSVGRLGGREVDYAAMLTSLLATSREWPAPRATRDWPTFAGAPSRTRIVDHEIDLGSIAWRSKLRQFPAEEGTRLDMGLRMGAFRDDRPRKSRWLLSYHPLLVEDLILVNTLDQVLAFDAATGRPAWGGESEVIYREESDQFASTPNRYQSWGSPRFTMTASLGRLYARLGSPITIFGAEMQRRGGLGSIVCLDLQAEGRLVWKLSPKFTPDDGKWTFEGSPICDGEQVYVAVRHSDVRPQSHVACYDAQTGQLRWTRYLCAAETPGSGQRDESTCNLLTLVGNRLYANTNLGAVAALDTRSGAIEWLTVYRTLQTGDLGSASTHFQRDLNPCVAYRGKLFVAPSDSEGIFAFDAATGDLLWESPHAADALQLLGVGSGNLIAAGNRLYWINIATGKLIQRWPEGPAPKGYGRGALVGAQVLWPTREDLYLLSQKTGRLEKVIQLAARHPGQTGGNLLVSDQRLFVAASDNLTCYSHYGQLPAAELASPTAPAATPDKNAPVAPSEP